jgi:hypothetical protein
LFFVLTNSTKFSENEHFLLFVPLELDSEFLKWFRDNGGVVNKMEIAHYSEMGRGFRTNESIPAGSELLRVPQKLWLTIDSVLADPEIGPILSQYPSLQQVHFSFFILYKLLVILFFS